ncbi:MAG: hypothetical protein HYZ28_22745 [Myxococcales bacterium]|nr:hypothetical protein [Myxococcales bacterium]
MRRSGAPWLALALALLGLGLGVFVDGAALTTSEVRELDKDGVPLVGTEVGGVRTRVTKWKRGPAGFVEQVENPDGFLTKLSRNLLGWPEECDPKKPGGAPNSRGLGLQLVVLGREQR